MKEQTISSTEIAQDAPIEACEEASQMTPHELAQLCETRATTYGLLARLYRTEINENMLKELTSMYYPVESGNELMDAGYYKIAKYLSNAWIDPLLELSVDYSKTFLGSGIDSYSAAYPYESVYTSEKRLLMQDARDEVLAIYRANGLDKSESWTVGEDHIAVELEFMRILNRRAAQALEKNELERAFSHINTQHNFMDDHISTWVPVFVNDMRTFASTIFYRGIADLTEGFLAEDALLLASLVEEDEAAQRQSDNADNATDAREK